MSRIFEREAIACDAGRFGPEPAGSRYVKNSLASAVQQMPRLFIARTDIVDAHEIVWTLFRERHDIAVKQDHGGTLNTGENNFYSLDELDTYNCRIRVILEPNEESKDAGKQGEAP